MPDLLAQIEAPCDVFMGYGAYDGEAVSDAVLAKQEHTKVVVLPHKTAVDSEAGDTQRDEHIRVIQEHARVAWQKANDYGLRSRVKLEIRRHKRTIGNCMKARGLPQQKTEAWVSAFALNMMINLGIPVSEKYQKDLKTGAH